MRLAVFIKGCPQQVACLQNQIAVLREFRTKAPNDPETVAVGCLEDQLVAVLGKGYETVQQVIAIVPPARHMQREVDLGRGEFGRVSCHPPPRG